MKQTIKFGKVRLARFGSRQVKSYEAPTAIVRAGVVRVKSL